MKIGVEYLRYSSERQTEQSIEGQMRVCDEYAAKNDIMIVDRYIDRALTATNDNRREFLRMIKDSEKKAWDYVLVYKLDRFSRDKYESAIHRHTLKMNGIKLVSAMENIPDTPEGIILESLLEGMNQYYSAELSQKVKRGMRETRLKGNFTGGFVMFGYKVENKKVIINEDEAEIVRQIYNDCANGKSVVSILQELHKKGITNRGKAFARNTLYHTLANEKYIGIYRFRGEVFDNMYPPIVSTEVFNIVKAKLDSNKYGKHKPDVCYVLKNKVICGYCGKPVNSDAGTSKSGKIMRYYKCSGKRINKNCSLDPIRKDLLENIVLDTTLKILANKENVSAIADRLIAEREKNLKNQSVSNLLNSELNEINRSISNILNAMEKGIITNSTKERLESLEERKTLVSEKLMIENAKEKTVLTKNEIIEHILRTVKENPKPMIEKLIKRIILYNDRIEIYYNYADRRTPDDESHREFCFYSFNTKIDTYRLGGEKISIDFEIKIIF